MSFESPGKNDIQNCPVQWSQHLPIPVSFLPLLEPWCGTHVEVGVYRIASGVRRAQEMLLLMSLVPSPKPQIPTSVPTLPMGLGEGKSGQ